MRHEQRLIFELWQLRQVLPKVLDRELESLGITMLQFGTLNAIAVAGPQSAADLARRADVRPQTMAAMLAGLADAGLLERRPHPVHKRVLLVGLTPAGQRLWEAASERVGMVERRLHETLGDSGYAAMRARTKALVAELGGAPAPQPVLWPPPADKLSVSLLTSQSLEYMAKRGLRDDDTGRASG